MTQVSADTAPLAEASGHRARGHDASEFSDVSFTSTLTDDQDKDFPAPMFSEASTSDLLPAKLSNGDHGTSSTYTSSQSYPDAGGSPSRSMKPISSNSSTAHKGKQPSNGHMIDLEHHKSGSLLSTIDSASAAGASSYAYVDAYSSSASGYVHDDSSRPYREHVPVDSADMDEAPYSPSTYPPTSEEDSEAKRVQQNLERWAAEERQRRKAQRSSKILSNRNPTISSAGGLTQRLSILRSAGFNNNNTNNLGAGPSSERLADGPGASPSMPYNPNMGDRSRDSAVGRGSASSSAGGARGLHRSPSSSSFDSSQSLGSMVSDDHRPNRKLPPIGSRVTSANHTRDTSGGSAKSLKGVNSGRLSGSVRDPFRDPSDGGVGEASPVISRKRTSLKPTPTASRPIVTVGRASSIQRRALESSYNSKGKGKGRSMPTIVATDTEAEAEAEADEMASRRAENPFASVEDRQRSKAATSTTIHQGGLDEKVAMEIAGRGSRGLDEHGDLGESTLDSDSVIRSQSARTSTSSSKFRELGITEGDDWIETMGRSMGQNQSRKMRITEHEAEREQARKPWWTELLCGCHRDHDDDEQAGRTNPMERPDSDDAMDYDFAEDAALLRDIAKAATQASQVVAQAEEPPRLSSRKALNGKDDDSLEALYTILLDSVKRSDLLRKEFSEFVPRDMRHSLSVPKKVSKTFIKTRAKKFLDFYGHYIRATRLRKVDQNILRAFEKALDELMDCFDHPKEAVGWNPFAALADFVEAGTVVRSPEVVQSCSRLTLGADWALLTQEHKKKIGPVLYSRLHELHYWRMTEIDGLLTYWDDKFPKESTCSACNTDPWEIFMLTTLVALKKEGTRYIDVETASDTSSESGASDEGDVEMGNGNSTGDDSELDDHQAQASEASSDEEDNISDGDIDLRLNFELMPYNASEELPRPPLRGLAPRQRFLHNYGPNQHILRIVSMNEFGCGTFKNSPIESCHSCGYRFDGQDPDPRKSFHRIIARAVEVARKDISEMKEVIELP
ncbi:hypothetical protein NDA16_002631 [Ustilago loliicola]|nr:hypothetical protein NDA16_002631 [Ustilago loliicola]